MTGYLCKYAPIELMAGFSGKGELLLPKEESLALAENYIYPSVCSYAKSVLQHTLKNHYDSLLFTDCCDAMKRVSDVLERQPGQRLYRISLPRRNDEEGIEWYAAILARFAAQLEREYESSFDQEAFLAVCRTRRKEQDDGPYIAVMGGRAPSALLERCREKSALPIRDLTCGTQERCFPDPPKNSDRVELLRWYAKSLLQQTPCMRMENTEARKDLLQDTNLAGIIYHTVKFCDFFSFEYASMETTVPMLKLETDFTTASPGQLTTRLEAFFEAIGAQKHHTAPRSRQAKKKAGTLYAGVDIGSTSTDAVIIDERGQLLAQAIIPTGAKSAEAANAALEGALKIANCAKADIANMVTTGYGRKAVDFDGVHITEISCHAKGVHCYFPEASTIIDIGGQDSKVIRLDNVDGVADFAMNDKCAAGTGRFLELMASTLNISLEEMSEMGSKWNEDIVISSMCAVFAESEVISLIAQNKETNDIVHGINVSIANRVAGLVARVRGQGPFVMSGGVAKNKGVILALEQKLGSPIWIAEEPQICGALGAALFAAAK